MKNESDDIRWKQRFQNYRKAYRQMEKCLEIQTLSEIERAGLIQLFEVSFELAWKLLKDYLQEEGFILKTPREAIKQAYQANLIQDGHLWLEALGDRNLTTHTYEEEIAAAVAEKIRNSYAPLLKQLFLDFQAKETK